MDRTESFGAVFFLKKNKNEDPQIFVYSVQKRGMKQCTPLVFFCIVISYGGKISKHLKKKIQLNEFIKIVISFLKHFFFVLSEFVPLSTRRSDLPKKA